VITVGRPLLADVRHCEWLDTGAANTASASDQALEALGALDGAKTADGKAAVARNAYKGATRHWLRELRRILRDQDEARSALLDDR
jgi:hypothetical protein